jgi:hypothetical protein
VHVQRLDRRLGQHRAEAEGHVGGVHHLEDGELQRLGQSLPAVGRVGGKAVPAALGEGAVGVGEARRGGHAAVLVPGAVLVPAAVQGRQHLFGQLRAALQHGGDGVVVEVRGELPQARDFGEREGQVADRRAKTHRRDFPRASLSRLIRP